MVAATKSQQIQHVIAPAVDVMGFELVCCELYRQQGRSVLRVFIDGPNGVNVDDCAKVSRQISATLDAEDLISGRYDLEVSSPGFNRPLVTLEHFRRFVGKRAHIQLCVPREGRRQYRGLIEAVENERITLDVEGAKVIMSLSEIDKANLDR